MIGQNVRQNGLRIAYFRGHDRDMGTSLSGSSAVTGTACLAQRHYTRQFSVSEACNADEVHRIFRPFDELSALLERAMGCTYTMMLFASGATKANSDFS